MLKRVLAAVVERGLDGDRNYRHRPQSTIILLPVHPDPQSKRGQSDFDRPLVATAH